MFKKAIREMVDEYIESDEFSKLLDTKLLAYLNDRDTLKKLHKRLEHLRADIEFEKANRNLSILEEKEQEMEKSSEPWFEMVSLGFDDEQGLRMKMFYNSAFLNQIRPHFGRAGEDEELMVQRWLLAGNGSNLMGEL